MKLQPRLAGGASALVLAFMSASSAAWAVEPAKAADKGAQLEELVVTAQRREESSQRVPISMTVLSGEQVAEHFRTSADIAQAVPNVQLGSPIGFGIPRTGIRGISQGDFNANATTSNMLYFDDVPLDAPVAQGAAIWDLGRVEVLRGPQGTLFGRNATGGAIRYISAMPTATAQGYADLTVGAHDQREVHAAYSTPIGDTLRARVSYASEDFGGDINNVILHTKQGKQKYMGVRGILEWTPSEHLTAVLRAQHFKSDQDIFSWKTTPGLTDSPGNFCGSLPDQTPCAHGYASVAQIQAAYGFKNLGYSSNYHTTETDIRPNEHIENTPVSLNIDYKMDWATLTSVTGFLDVRESLLIDNDASPAPFLNEYDRYYNRQWSQEFRLTSADDGPFKWIAGAFYMKEFVKARIDFDATAWKTNESDLFPDAKTVTYGRGDRNHLETYAGFLHTTYQVTPDLMLTAAARYTHETRSIDYIFRTQWDFPTAVPGTTQQFSDWLRAMDSGNRGVLLAAANPATLSASKAWSGLTWKIGLDYHINPRTMVYGLISKGFKGGAFNATSNTPGGVLAPDGSVISVRPETVVDYEAGVKSDLIPGRLRVNGSVFYYDYRNYQTNQLVPTLGVQILSNLPKSELYGVELEVEAIPIENLTLSFGMGALHTEILKSTDPSLIGNKLPLAEDFNWNAMIRYDIHTDIGVFSPEFSAKHIGNYFGTKENISKAEMGDYTLLNARIGFESANGKYYGALWGTNLADTIRPVAIDDPDEFWGGNLSNVNQHRRYGLTVGVRF
jgi:iron complex outermembrane receptor protein